MFGTGVFVILLALLRKTAAKYHKLKLIEIIHYVNTATITNTLVMRYIAVMSTKKFIINCNTFYLDGVFRKISITINVMCITEYM